MRFSISFKVAVQSFSHMLNSETDLTSHFTEMREMFVYLICVVPLIEFFMEQPVRFPTFSPDSGLQFVSLAFILCSVSLGAPLSIFVFVPAQLFLIIL